MATMNERLFDLVKRIVDPRYKDSLTVASRLLEESLLDSFGLIQLVAEIEKEFSISIKTEDLTSQNFSSVADMSTLVERTIANGK